jgi:hypothetical protein
MAFYAMAAPILAGKTEQWKRFIAELAGPRRAEFEQTRRELGVRERVFFQQSDGMALAIVTWEGDEPERTLERMSTLRGPFAQWFIEQVKELHGMDLSRPSKEPPSKPMLDSQGGQPSATQSSATPSPRH